MGIIGDAWDFVTGNSGSGKYEQDPNAFEYGGEQGFARKEGDYYRGLAQQMQGRGNPQQWLDYANADRGAAYDSRGGQGDATGLLRQAAYGQAPSVAQLQMQQGANAAIAAQQAAANSTRGNFGLANAQRNAMNAGMQMQQQNIMNQGIARAQEMAQARDAYMQGMSQRRAQDLQQMGLDTGAGFQQMGLNDQTMLGLEAARGNVFAQQLAAQQERERIRSGVANNQANRNQNMVFGLMNAASAAATGGASGMNAAASGKGG